MHEATGSSPEGWEQAILDAIRQGRSVGRVIGFEVLRFAGEVSRGRISTYRTTVKVAYREDVQGP